MTTSGHDGSIRKKHLYQTIAQFDKTIVLPRKLATGSIIDYLFCYCLLVGILFEVLWITVIVLSIKVPTVTLSMATLCKADQWINHLLIWRASLEVTC